MDLSQLNALLAGLGPWGILVGVGLTILAQWAKRKFPTQRGSSHGSVAVERPARRPRPVGHPRRRRADDPRPVGEAEVPDPGPRSDALAVPRAEPRADPRPARSPRARQS